MYSLELFNCVLEKPTTNKNPHITSKGYIIEPNALWCKKDIVDYYKKQELTGNDLNKTFHKSWSVIKNSDRVDLFLEQITHYLSTYGSDFQDEIYIPNETLNLPKNVTLKYKVIKGVTKKELINKCFNLINSGIALESETINKLITLLIDELDYTFTGEETIKNKEFNIILAENYNIYPKNPTEFLRLVLYRTIGQTLLIKNEATYSQIKESTFNPTLLFKSYGLDKLSTIFNRFKPIFLSYKDRCPKTINKISKLSKVNHKPMVSNPLNNISDVVLSDANKHWLDNATVFSLFKTLNYLYRLINNQDTFVYKIRNGKTYYKTKNNFNQKLINNNFDYIINYLKGRLSNLNGRDIYIPKNIEYGLPTSEKMFLGNIPYGTKIIGDRLCVGTYWSNDMGILDLDLSGLSIGGKVGWNASYNNNSLYYSGDITSAPNGAVEYLYADNKYSGINVINANIYSYMYSDDEERTVTFKLILGNGDDIDYDYMMNPSNLIFENTIKPKSSQTMVGLLSKENNKQVFTIYDFNTGNRSVSNMNPLELEAFKQEVDKSLTFNNLMEMLGVNIINEKKGGCVDLSFQELTIDSFIKLLK